MTSIDTSLQYLWICISTFSILRKVKSHFFKAISFFSCIAKIDLPLVCNNNNDNNNNNNNNNNCNDNGSSINKNDNDKILCQLFY